MMTRHFRLIRMARIRTSFVHVIAIAIANCHCYCCCQVLASSSRWKNRELVLHVIRLFKELEVSDTEHRNRMCSASYKSARPTKSTKQTRKPTHHRLAITTSPRQCRHHAASSCVVHTYVHIHVRSYVYYVHLHTCMWVMCMYVAF